MNHGFHYFTLKYIFHWILKAVNLNIIWLCAHYIIDSLKSNLPLVKVINNDRICAFASAGRPLISPSVKYEPAVNAIMGIIRHDKRKEQICTASMNIFNSGTEKLRSST